MQSTLLLIKSKNKIGNLSIAYVKLLPDKEYELFLIPNWLNSKALKWRKLASVQQQNNRFGNIAVLYSINQLFNFFAQ